MKAELPGSLVLEIVPEAERDASEGNFSPGNVRRPDQRHLEAFLAGGMLAGGQSPTVKEMNLVDVGDADHREGGVDQNLRSGFLERFPASGFGGGFTFSMKPAGRVHRPRCGSIARRQMSRRPSQVAMHPTTNRGFWYWMWPHDLQMCRGRASPGGTSKETLAPQWLQYLIIGLCSSEPGIRTRLKRMADGAQHGGWMLAPQPSPGAGPLGYNLGLPEMPP